MSIQHGLFINNEFRASSSGETLAVHDPFDGNLVSDQIQVASSKDVDMAVEAAQAAFRTWRFTPSKQRSSAMLKYAALVEAHAEEVARLESRCMGAPMMLARRVVESHVAVFRYYAGLVDKIKGTVYSEDGDGVLKMIWQQPIGVCAGIGAWNATPIFSGWKIAPALAAGNTFIFKSSEKSPLGTLYLGQFFLQAGFPPGVVNLLSGGPSTGALLASHPLIRKISYTGSTRGGRAVQLAAAQSNLKTVTLELGGKSAALVFDDADLATAIAHNSQTFVLNNAQVCSVSSRALIHNSIAEDFIRGVRTAFTQLATAHGSPAEDSTFLGPLVDEAQRQRVQEFIEEARNDGIPTVMGHAGPNAPALFIPPTVLIDPRPDSRAYREEIFGPVLTIRTFETEAEALALANDSEFGLAANIFTSSIDRAMRVARALDVGMVSINSPVLPLIQLPWGGCKESGYGREGGLEGLAEYLHTKSVVVRTNNETSDGGKH